VPGRDTAAPGRRALLDWQEGYIRAFVAAVRATLGDRAFADEALNAAVTERMNAYLPTDDLLFLMQLSIAPVRNSFAAR